MERVKRNIVYGVLSAATGLAGMAALARCAGAGCTACFGCAVPGAGILLISLVQRKRRKGKHGVA